MRGLRVMDTTHPQSVARMAENNQESVRFWYEVGAESRLWRKLSVSCRGGIYPALVCRSPIDRSRAAPGFIFGSAGASRCRPYSGRSNGYLFDQLRHRFEIGSVAAFEELEEGRLGGGDDRACGGHAVQGPILVGRASGVDSVVRDVDLEA